MSHTDYISELPTGFEVIAYTADCPIAAMQNVERNIYGVQFHPEVEHCLDGDKVLRNFLYNICKVKGDWTTDSFIEDKIKEIKEKVGDRKALCGLFIEDKIKEIKEKVGDRKALCGLSGGVDSSVAAVLMHRAIGDNLTCVFVDHGLLRKDEGDDVERIFRDKFDMNLIRVNAEDRFLSKLKGVTEPERKRKAAVLMHRAIGDNLTCVFVDHGLLRKDEGDDVERIFRDKFDMNLIRVNAEDRFLSKLKGVTEPERKRKIIGEEFIRVFEEESEKLGKMDFLVQGTIYADVIESGHGNGAATIKSHHNVGGLPEDVDFQEIIEPLRELFKDEVRRIGLELGIDEDLIYRHPFPGPGLGIRVIGEVTKEKCDILREADAIYMEELKKAGLYKEIWQAFATLPDVKTVGVMGDERTYAYLVGIRAVSSSDGMTSDWYKMPYDVLEKISNRIVNEVEGANRVVYDIYLVGIRAVSSSDGMTSDWYKMPYDVLEKISNRIVNEVEGANRVVYDITSKPPGTIEWE